MLPTHFAAVISVNNSENTRKRRCRPKNHTYIIMFSVAIKGNSEYQLVSSENRMWTLGNICGFHAPSIKRLWIRAGYTTSPEATLSKVMRIASAVRKRWGRSIRRMALSSRVRCRWTENSIFLSVFWTGLPQTTAQRKYPNNLYSSSINGVPVHKFAHNAIEI
jgi:hypothetical protein